MDAVLIFFFYRNVYIHYNVNFDMEKERLIEAVRKFGNKRIGVVGDVVLDKYVYGKVERVNPENPGAPLIKIERKEFRLGCAANVALNISSMDALITLGCVFGDDINGATFEKLCAEKNITLAKVKEGETILKERVIESEFNQYLLRSDDGESVLNSIGVNSSNILYGLIENTEIDAIILSDYDKLIFRNGFGNRLIEFARGRGIPVVVDPKPSNAHSFKGATLMCPNIKEAREILKESNIEAKDAAKKLRELFETKYSIITCGKKGMVCYDGKDFTEIPTKVREVQDVTGAGDTVCAVIAMGLATGLSLVESAHLANYAAGVVVEKLGTSTLTREELIERIEQDGNV
jgi:D-glycero-beta-D-manno-heptose-7-phosphate kinase